MTHLERELGRASVSGALSDLTSSRHRLCSAEDSGREERPLSLPLQWSDHLHHTEEEVWLVKTQLHESVRAQNNTRALLLTAASASIIIMFTVRMFSSNMFSFVCRLSDIQPRARSTPPASTSSSGSFRWRTWRWWKVRPDAWSIAAVSCSSWFFPRTWDLRFLFNLFARLHSGSEQGEHPEDDQSAGWGSQHSGPDQQTVRDPQLPTPGCFSSTS